MDSFLRLVLNSGTLALAPVHHSSSLAIRKAGDWWLLPIIIFLHCLSMGVLIYFCWQFRRCFLRPVLLLTCIFYYLEPGRYMLGTSVALFLQTAFYHMRLV